MIRCRIPQFFERYKEGIGICNPKGKRILARSVKEKNMCFYIHQNHCGVICKKDSKDRLPNGIEEKEENFKYVKNKLKEDNSGHSISCRFPKHETIDQLENEFVFSLEVYNDQELAEVYTAGLYNVNRLQYSGIEI